MLTSLPAVPASTPLSMLFPIPTDHIFSPLTLILLALSPVPILILSEALQPIVSTWARNEEEAFTFLAPWSFLSLFVVFAGFFMDEFTPSP